MFGNYHFSNKEYYLKIITNVFAHNNYGSFTKTIYSADLCIVGWDLKTMGECIVGEAWGDPSERDGCSLYKPLGRETFSLFCLFSLSLLELCISFSPLARECGNHITDEHHALLRALWMTPLRAVPHFWISLFVSHLPSLYDSASRLPQGP